MSGRKNNLATPVALDGTENVGASTIVVNTSAVKLADSRKDRRALLLDNKGSSPVYLGFDSSVAAGASAIGFGVLNGGEDKTIEHYSGEIWGIAGISTQYVGRAEIYG